MTMAAGLLGLHRVLKPTRSLYRVTIRERARGSESSPIKTKLNKQQPKDGRRSSKDTARVDRFSFQGLSQSDGEPVNDLNDLMRIGTDSYRSSAKVINNEMRF